jgi:hypothetical protein
MFCPISSYHGKVRLSGEDRTCQSYGTRQSATGAALFGRRLRTTSDVEVSRGTTDSCLTNSVNLFNQVLKDFDKFH